MYKLAHIADTHIKNLKYHYEYRIIFKELYEKLAEEKPDFIVHCGDLAHTKTQLSPEYFELATEFMKNLADINPIYELLVASDSSQTIDITNLKISIGLGDTLIIALKTSASVSGQVSLTWFEQQ
jgi:DNA repair exonuclease SbcCD nuclease subunit